MPEVIKEISASKGYTQDMVKYSIIVNRRRAFPDIIDGLKPVQRNVLIDMWDQGAVSFEKRVKSSAIVGDTMKKYHPHGDSSIYGTMEPLATWFNCKIPLIAPKGNWGTLMGDSPAAMRYTEAGLSEFGYDCVIGDLKDHKGVVDWVDNHDRKLKKPEYLPVKVPLLLINGTFGIGVGLSVSIPTFNLNEVLEATRHLIRHPEDPVVLIPDHCQPCYILDTDWRKISETGRGSYRVRGIVEIGEFKGDPAIFIRSLPNGVSTATIMEALNKIIAAKQLPMVKDINDATTKDAVEIIISLKKGSDPYYVKELLYVKTKVQDTCTVNFEVVDGVDPRRMGYKEYLLSFLKQRALTKFRLYCNKLQTAKTKAHHLEAYIRILESGEIDNVINMIRKQSNIDDNYLTEYLIKKLNITDLQAKYILGTDIRRLSKGYLAKYKKEYAELMKEEKLYEAAVTDNGSFIMNEIDNELKEIQRKYGSPRLCKVIRAAEENAIPKGTFKVVVTERNYIRKLPDTDKVGTVKKDNPKFILRVDNAENLLLFDNKGKVFKLPISKIPVSDRNSPGTDIRILVKNLTSDVIAVHYEPIIHKIVDGDRKHYMTVVTKMNSIKRLDLEDFTTVNTSGLMYSKLTDGDEVAGIQISPVDLDIVMYSAHKALRVPTNKIPLFKRNATGSKAMNTNDLIEGLSVIYPDTQYIVVITKNGMINRFNVAGLSKSDRAKAGSAVIKLDKNDSIFAIYGVNENDYIHIVTSMETIDIPVSNIKLFSSVAKGTKMIDTRSTNIVRVDVFRK